MCAFQIWHEAAVHPRSTAREWRMVTFVQPRSTRSSQRATTASSHELDASSPEPYISRTHPSLARAARTLREPLRLRLSLVVPALEGESWSHVWRSPRSPLSPCSLPHY